MAFSEFKVTTEKTNVNNLNFNLQAKTVRGHLMGFFFIDNDTKQYVAYFPALEISGYGETKEKAEEMAKFSINQLFDYLMELSKNQLDIELKKFGWKKSVIFNKQFSNAFVDINGALQNFNVKENSLSQVTLTAA
jgi:predicted RNase H-like HicB family nuclease